MSGVGAGEPPFVGEQRQELVDRLLAEFDRVCESRGGVLAAGVLA